MISRERCPGYCPIAVTTPALRHSWRRDVLAGVTVGVVALPPRARVRHKFGVGASAGLITAVVAGFVAAVFGGSHVQVSGPTGAMAVVPRTYRRGARCGQHCAGDGSGGVIVVTAGLTGLGRAVTFIPGR